MVQFLIWLLPPIFYFFLVWFFRKNVEDPHLPRITYFGILPMLIPILGVIAGIVILCVVIVFSATGDIEYKEGTKFSKRWLD